MICRTRFFILFSLLMFALAGSRGNAHPLIRIHVRPAAYRLAPPRLPSLLPSASSVIHQAGSLVPLGAALVPAGAAPQAVLNVLRHR